MLSLEPSGKKSIDPFLPIAILFFMFSSCHKKSPKITLQAFVPGAGLEPARPSGHKILSLACLPVPPPRQRFSSESG